MTHAPTGTVTFLFTDVEGSTRLWIADEASMAASLRVHDEVLRSVIENHGGHVFSTAGDSFAAAFQDAPTAVSCAVAIQEALATTAWPGPALPVRIGMHRGTADERDGDYFGAAVSTTARVEAAGHGGQVLCTESVRSTVKRSDIVQLGEHRLRDVAEPTALFQVGSAEFPRLRVVPPQSIRLPAPANALVGQGRVVHSIRAALLDRRLVTVTGVGGAGKTRVALEVAEQEIPHFPDGVVFVDLAAVADPTDVPDAVLNAADVRIGHDETATDALIRFVDGRSVLLVIDNCEHVIEDAAEVVEAILATRSATKVLATSRELLDVDGEHVVQIPSLDTAPGGAAGELFVDRATAAGATVSPTDGTIVALCERLDGMPLAIELAAARTATMSPGELLERLEDRFSLLARPGRRRRGRSRQRTLQATIDWSYALLTGEEQALQRACSVFDDLFDLDAACAVADIDTTLGADLVASLAAKSLLAVAQTPHGSRYRLLETVRAFGDQKLLDHGETALVRRRLVDHVAETYIPPDDRIQYETRWGSHIEANHPTVTTATDLAEGLDLPPRTRCRILTASLLRPPVVAQEFWSRTSVSLPNDADPDEESTRYATVVIAARGRMHRGDYAGAQEYNQRLLDAPEPWPWWAISNFLRIHHRHDPERFAQELPPAAAPVEDGAAPRAAFSFHVQSAPSVGGIDRDAGLAHLDELARNPLVEHALARSRFAGFRYGIEAAWAGPGGAIADPPDFSLMQVDDPFTAYKDPGAGATRQLAEQYRKVRRDPSNYAEGIRGLVLLAMAAEAREQPDVARTALLAFQWQSSWNILGETVAPVVARRLGFLDVLSTRDLDDAEMYGLGKVFTELAPRFDSAIAESTANR